MCVCVCVIIYTHLENYKLSYLPTPLLEQVMTQGQYFKRSLTALN